MIEPWVVATYGSGWSVANSRWQIARLSGVELQGDVRGEYPFLPIDGQ